MKKQELANNYFFSFGQAVEIFIANPKTPIETRILNLRNKTLRFVSYADNDMVLVESAGRRYTIEIDYIIAK